MAVRQLCKLKAESSNLFESTKVKGNIMSKEDYQLQTKRLHTQ